MKATIGRVIFADGTPIAVEGGGAEQPAVRWIHVANAGMYRGHHQGEFELTAEHFVALVKNFRDDPRYKASTVATPSGEKTLGSNPVLQFDYEHASEMFPGEGSIPQAGAPAPAWVLDVEVRAAADGTAQLWALASLGDQIRGQIERNEYRFVSIAFNPEGQHWQTGQAIGPVLTSIAFTNQPFLRDLEPLAAANRPSPGASNKPPGAVQPQASRARDANHTLELSTMTEEQIKALCKLLGIKSLQDGALEEAVGQAVSDSGALGELLSALGVPDAATALQAVPALMDARAKLADAQRQLDELLAMQATVDEAMAQADVGAAMSAKRSQDPALQNALLTYHKHCITEEVAKVKDAAERVKQQATPKQLADARIEARKRFLSEYNVPETSKAHLLTSFVAGPGGAQLTPPAASPKPPPAGGAQLGLSDRSGGGLTIDLSAMPGVNQTQKLTHWLRANVKGAEKWGDEQLILTGRKLKASENITIVGA